MKSPLLVLVCMFGLWLSPSLTARTLLERSLNGREWGLNYDNTRHKMVGKSKICVLAKPCTAEASVALTLV